MVWLGGLAWWFGFRLDPFMKGIVMIGVPGFESQITNLQKKHGILHWHRFLHVFPLEDGFFRKRPTHRRIILRKTFSTLGQMDGLFEGTLYGDAWMISVIYYLTLLG